MTNTCKIHLNVSTHFYMFMNLTKQSMTNIGIENHLRNQINSLNKEIHTKQGIIGTVQDSPSVQWRLHRCWWRMLKTKCVGDNFEILVIVFAVFGTIIHYHFTYSRAPTSKRCHEYLNSVTTIQKVLVTYIYVACCDCIPPYKMFKPLTEKQRYYLKQYMDFSTKYRFDWHEVKLNFIWEKFRVKTATKTSSFRDELKRARKDRLKITNEFLDVVKLLQRQVSKLNTKGTKGSADPWM